MTTEREKTREQPASTSGAQTLERGLLVLSELSRHAEGLTIAQVASTCRLNRSVAGRLLVSLSRTGFARRDELGRYTIGPAAARLTAAARPSLPEVAGPVLQELSNRVGLAVCLIEADHEAAVTTLVAYPAIDGPQFAYRLGHREPLDRGAGGVAAMASQPAREAEDAVISSARHRGYAVTHGEVNPGAHGVAVPLPGWDSPASVTIVSYDVSVIDHVRVPLLEAAASIGQHALRAVAM